jgi:hypothetical protein
VAQQHLRVLRHDGAREGVALVSSEVMAVSPPATDKLLKVVAWIKLLVPGREVVKNLRCRVDASWSQAHFAVLFVVSIRLITR